jgi:Transglutaminase-like superfamily
VKRLAFLLILMTVAAILISNAVISPASLADQTSIPSRTFEFKYVVHVPALPAASHQFRMWVPLPYQDSSQLISQLHIESPVPGSIRREPQYNDRYAYTTLDPSRVKSPFDVQITFRTTRLEHRVPLDSTNDIPAQPIVQPARFLRPDRLVPIDGQIAELSNEQTKGVTLPLEKARKIYDYVIATMHYDHDGTGWGRGDAVWACDAKHGNCTDFHSLFIAMARAAGIPARFEIGFPLPQNSHEGAIAGYHCWAQFYVQGIGWIPIDASEAWKDKSKIDYFFGATDQNRVMFSLGRDIRLVPAQSGEPLNYFVYPYAELDGQPFTGLKNEFSFRDDTAPQPPATTGGK